MSAFERARSSCACSCVCVRFHERRRTRRTKTHTQHTHTHNRAHHTQPRHRGLAQNNNVRVCAHERAVHVRNFAHGHDDDDDHTVADTTLGPGLYNRMGFEHGPPPIGECVCVCVGVKGGDHVAVDVACACEGMRNEQNPVCKYSNSVAACVVCWPASGECMRRTGGGAASFDSTRTTGRPAIVPDGR